MDKIIIIGAGIGGLCSAIRLLYNGYKVVIIEKEDRVGGKVNRLESNGYRFDLTASIIMTPKIYTSLFEDVGKDYKDYFTIKKLTPMYKAIYSDDMSYDFYSELDKMNNELDKIESGLSIQYMDFLTKSLDKYVISKKYGIDKDMLNLSDITNLETIKKFISIKPTQTTNDYLEGIIKNEKLRNFLIFQSMYIGINPYTNSSIYTLIPAISQAYGLHYIDGGMYSYVQALEKLVIDLGGDIIKNEEVQETIIADDKVEGVRTKKQIYECSKCISNVDFPYTIKNLIKEDITENAYKKSNIESKDYSCSVFMIYLGLNKKINNLQVHNIYINDNFREGIESCFTGNLIKNPSLYIYNPSKIDDTLCEKDKTSLNIMIRVPNLKESKIDWNDNFSNKYMNDIIDILSGIEGLEDIKDVIEYKSYLTPRDFKERFNSYNGTAFGLSHNLKQIGYFRPHIKSKKIKNLYYMGTSTHPGNGVSVIIEGTKLIEKVILLDDN